MPLEQSKKTTTKPVNGLLNHLDNGLLLTDKEIEALKLLDQGYKFDGAAEILRVATHTIKARLQAARRRNSLSTLYQLMADFGRSGETRAPIVKQ